SVDVTTVPHVDAASDIKTEKLENVETTSYIKTDFFDVYQWNITGKAAFEAIAPYTLVSVLEGEGTLSVEAGDYPLHKGTHFILPNEIKNWSIDGTLQIIASTPGTSL
ncbi:MAG: mannose-6-phosphate isomerase, partial [Carnobacterium sp.]